MEFDGQLVRLDSRVKDLMDEFVRVRITDMKGLDLSTFQFDFDLTFVVFMLNADGTIYGRFGTRSDFKQAERDISFEGLRKAMESALDLHRDYPKFKWMLEGKTPPAPRFPTVDEYPWLKERRIRNPNFCVSCHMVLNAERLHLRGEGKPIPDDVLYPWPLPILLGLELDPKEMAGVNAVTPGSPAAAAGFKPGDEIRTLGGQVMLSTADVQWVLTSAAEPGKLDAVIHRGEGEQQKTLTLDLPEGWRTGSDLSWRSSTWLLRGQVMGRLKLFDIPDNRRAELGLGRDQMALRVTRPFRPQFEGAKAGIKLGDIIVGYGKAKERMTESQLLAWGMRNTRAGQEVSITVLRGDRRVVRKLKLK